MTDKQKVILEMVYHLEREGIISAINLCRI